MTKLNNILYKLEIAALIALLVLLLVIVIIEIILRYYGAPLYWSEEMARYLFIWLVMIGCAAGVKQNSHFKVDFIVNRFNPKLQKVIYVLGAIIGIIFLSYLLVYGVILCIKTGSVASPALGIAQYYGYMAIPVGAFLMLVHFMFHIYNAFFNGGD